MTALRDIKPGLLFKTRVSRDVRAMDKNYVIGNVVDVLYPGEHFLVISLIDFGWKIAGLWVLTPRTSGYIGIHQWTLNGVELVTPTT